MVVLALMLLGIDRYSRTEAGRLGPGPRENQSADLRTTGAEGCDCPLHAYPGDPARSGVPVLTSMDIVKNVVSNRVLEHVIEEAATTFVRDRISLPRCVAASCFLAGDPHDRGRRKSGKLEDMLMRVADTFERMSKPRFRG